MTIEVVFNSSDDAEGFWQNSPSIIILNVFANSSDLFVQLPTKLLTQIKSIFFCSSSDINYDRSAFLRVQFTKFICFVNWLEITRSDDHRERSNMLDTFQPQQHTEHVLENGKR